MSLLLKYAICAAVVLLIFGTTMDATPLGFLEGHVKISSPKEVELADGTSSGSATIDYTGYPLIILSKDRKTDVARVTPDNSGKYRIALPPGEYVLDIQRRWPKGHVRASPQSFTVISSQTVQVDMAIDTGVR